MAKTRAALIEEIRRDVPFERLFAVVIAVLRERSGSDAIELAQMKEPERLLDEFLQTCTVRQLKLLRQIALNLEGGVEQ
jgi:hypothetical protein